MRPTDDELSAIANRLGRTGEQKRRHRAMAQELLLLREVGRLTLTINRSSRPWSDAQSRLIKERDAALADWKKLADE